jgi:hypothetical protein
MRSVTFGESSCPDTMKNFGAYQRLGRTFRIALDSGRIDRRFDNFTAEVSENETFRAVRSLSQIYLRGDAGI